MERKLIRKVTVNQANMIAAGDSREVTVFGDVGAEFNINIIKINGTSKESYYNFKTSTFTDAFVAANNLHVKLASGTFARTIIFPADASGEVYSIKTIAKEQTTKFVNGNFVDVKDITQVGQTTIGIQVPNAGVTTFDDNLTGLPASITSTGSTALPSPVTVPVTFTFTNTSSDTKGFGLRLPGLPASNEFVIPDSFWYSQQVVVVNGAHTGVTEITVDAIGFITAGMELDGVLDGGTTKIYVSSVSGNVITLTAAISASNDAQLLFKAYGPSLIQSIFGCEVEFSNFVARGTPIQKEVRTSTTFPQSDGNVDLELTGTYGLGGGSHVRLEGFNMNNSGNNNLITVVSPSSTAGGVTINYSGASEAITKANVVPVGTKLNVIGSYQVITVTGNIKIKKYPDTSAKVVLDTTQIITAGTADE